MYQLLGIMKQPLLEPSENEYLDQYLTSLSLHSVQQTTHFMCCDVNAGPV